LKKMEDFKSKEKSTTKKVDNHKKKIWLRLLALHNKQIGGTVVDGWLLKQFPTKKIELDTKTSMKPHFS
jgi:hypothetical protein